MAILQDQPTNPNFLSPLNFRFSIRRTPNITYFLTGLSSPSLEVPFVNTSNPFITIPQPGDHITYSDLIIKFKVDEDLKNYLEIHDWIRALGKPNFSEYKALIDNEKTNPINDTGRFSELSLMILNSAHGSNYEMIFETAFPYNISGLEFDSGKETVDYIEATAAFKYVKYELKQI